ncbi:MAG: Integrase family protein [Nitrosopumilales archaeon]|nr:MAG: Integrase family protein [Nitrosopumilales archaeon]
MKRVRKFNKNCESFKNFDDGIRRDATRRTYHYSFDDLVRFGNFEGYDDITKLDTDEIHDLLKEWIRTQKNKNLRFKTIKTKLNAAELFFGMNKKIIYNKLLHKMLPDSDEVPGGDVPFSTEDLSRLKQVAKKRRDIAIIDFLASTGVRPGCLSDPVLKLKHLADMPHDCKAIKVYDGSKEGYWAFLTPEASKSLDRYLKWRKFNGEELSDESVLFKNYENPHKKMDYLTADSVREMLTNMLKIAGIERKKSKNRYDKGIVIGFRKRFNGILKMNNEVNSNIAEKLMAHKKGLDGHYLKPTVEECFTEFRKAIPALTVDPTERQNLKIEKLEQEKTENKKLEDKISSLEKKVSDSEHNVQRFIEELVTNMDKDKTNHKQKIIYK